MKSTHPNNLFFSHFGGPFFVIGAKLAENNLLSSSELLVSWRYPGC
jgi:hypothetical protein